MRLFFAVDMPEKVKDEIARLAKKYPLIESVSKNNLHITLKFIGEVDNPDGLIKNAETIKSKKFFMNLEGVGAFPDKNYPRIVWIGAGKGEEELANLAVKIDRATVDWRINEHNFVPHLTVSRCKNGCDNNIFNEHFKTTDFEVGEFLLMKSALTPKGAEYKIVKRFKLE